MKMLSAAVVGPFDGLMAVATGFAVVASVFVLAMLTLWFLRTKLGMRLTAHVTGEAESGIGRLKVITSGPGGYFVALVVLALSAIFLVVKLLVA